MTRFADDVGLQ